MSDRIDVTATIRATDNASAAINAISRSLKGLQEGAKSVGEAFKHVAHYGAFGGLQHGVQHFGTAVGHATHALHSLLEPLAAIAGIAGGFSVEQSIESYIGDAEHLLRMSQILGTTVDNLGAYENAARKAGVETEGFDKAMQFANVNLRKAAVGSDKNLVGLFGKLGINLQAIRNGSKSAMDYLPQLSEAMRAQTSAQARLAIARAVFGRAGGAMIPFLMQERAELEKQTKGYLAQDHITRDSAEHALELGHAQKDLARTFLSVRDAVMNVVTPTLTEALRKFMEVFERNRVPIVRALTTAIGGLAHGLEHFDWEGFFHNVEKWVGWIKTAVDWVGGWQNALVGLAIIMNIQTISAMLHVGAAATKLGIILGQGLLRVIVGLSSGMARAALFMVTNFVPAILAVGRAFVAFGAMLMANPIGLVLGLLALLAVAVYAIYRNWDTIGPYFWRAWAAVKSAFWSAIGWLHRFFTEWVPNALKANWTEMKPFFAVVWAGVRTAFDAASAWLTGTFFPLFTPEGIKNAWSGLTDWFSKLWASITGVFDRAWAHLQPIVDAIKSVGNLFPGGGTPAIAGGGDYSFPVRPEDLAFPGFGSILGAGAPGAPGASGTVRVDVNLNNAPPGTTATTTTTGNLEALIGQSMVWSP